MILQSLDPQPRDTQDRMAVLQRKITAKKSKTSRIEQFLVTVKTLTHDA